MSNDKYAKAYKEVFEIISLFPEEDYNKIPKEKIEFYKNNMDNDYDFSIDPNIDLEEQNISDEANAIIISIFQDYFATEEQNTKINEILELNEKKDEQEKKEKHSYDDLFKEPDDKRIIAEEEKTENELIEQKESFFTRFKNFIMRLLHKNR